jgi:DNA-binding transcriptional ArsR family regulator
MTYETVITALADPTRRAILEALREGPRSVTELAGDMPVSRPAVSQHLAVLTAADLVSSTQQGTRRLYEANAAGLEALRHYLETYWGDLLGAFAAEATRTRARKPRGKK